MPKIVPNRVGERNKNMTIVAYRSYKDVDIVFDGHPEYIKTVKYSKFLDGGVRNPYEPSVCNVGYFGVGEYSSRINGVKTKAYTTWSSMIGRCYSDNKRIQRECYEKVEVATEWHNFQNLAKWHEENYPKDFPEIEWQLDKDILSNGSKIYSPNTCIFVPKPINLLFTVDRSLKEADLPIGVTRKENKYSARINKYGKLCNLGHFNTPEEAHQVYKNAKKELLEEMLKDYTYCLSEETISKIQQGMINSLAGFKE